MENEKSSADVAKRAEDSVREEREQLRRAEGVAKRQHEAARQKANSIRNDVIRPLFDEAVAALKAISWRKPEYTGELNGDTFTIECWAGRRDIPREPNYRIKGTVSVLNDGLELALSIGCYVSCSPGVFGPPPGETTTVPMAGLDDDFIRKWYHGRLTGIVRYMHKATTQGPGR
jgi:hypothetical protein